jgi:chromosome segregation ATPase
MKSDDIVDRLREPMNVLQFDDITEEAAEEITRLRSKALGNKRRIEEQDAIMAELWERIHSLTAERDEARREVCSNEANHLPTMADPRREAKRRGWDCFKEDGK